MVDYVSDANELARRVRAWAFAPAVDDDGDVRAAVQVIPGVTADVICEAAEIMYAHRDLLDENGLRVMAELFNYADNQGWTAFNQEGRSKRIVEGAAFDLGDRKTKPSGPNPEPQKQRREGLDWRPEDEQKKEDVQLPEPKPPADAEPTPD